MKRYFIILVILAVIFSFSGCGKEADVPVQTTTAPTSVPEPVVSPSPVVTDEIQHDFHTYSDCSLLFDAASNCVLHKDCGFMLTFPAEWVGAYIYEGTDDCDFLFESDGYDITIHADTEYSVYAYGKNWDDALKEEYAYLTSLPMLGENSEWQYYLFAENADTSVEAISDFFSMVE